MSVLDPLLRRRVDPSRRDAVSSGPSPGHHGPSGRMIERPEAERGGDTSAAAAAGAGSPRRRSAMSARDVSILRSLAERIDPRDAGAHNNLGVVFFQKGLVEDAVVAFERALELDPRLEVARRNAEVAFLESGQFRARVRSLSERLSAAPGDAAARDALARTFLLGGDPEGAARHWGILLEQRPESVPLLMKLAYADMERGQTGRALTLLERAAQLSPEEAAIHLQLAELLHQRGELERSGGGAPRPAARRRHGPRLGPVEPDPQRTRPGRRGERRAGSGGDARSGRAEHESHLSLERYRSASVARRARVPRTRKR